jgi:hypothetical protein
MKRILVKIWRLVTDVHSRSTVPAQQAPAHCTNIMTLLAHLCDFDDEMRQWVLRWLAFQLRNPGAKMSTALVFNGGQGSGKSLFAQHVVAALFGDAATAIRPHDLESRFNGWAVDANLVVVDGEFSPHHLARMKAYSSAESVIIDRKYQAPQTVRNRLNFVCITHDDYFPSLREAGNRRFAVVDVPPAQPRAFYQAVAHEIANGGPEAFRDYLLHVLDMGSFNASTQPPQPAIRNSRQAA